MSKFIIAKTTSFTIVNYKKGAGYIQMDLPMSYTLLDIITIIKIFSDYGDTFDWTFENPRDKKKNLSYKKDKDKIAETRFDEYKDISPEIYCFYGPICIKIGARGFLKYKKVYPTIYQAKDGFPTEKEIKKNLDLENKYTQDTLNTIGLHLKNHFSTIYKISTTTILSFFGEENELIKK